MGRLVVYAPDGAAERLARAYDLDPEVGMTNEFTFVTYPAEPFEVGPFTVSVTLVDHPAPAYALKIVHNDTVLVYSGDTGPCAALEELAAGADLLLAEASFVEGNDNPHHLHLTGRQAATLAEQAKVGRLVLTHIPPWHRPDDVLAQAVPHFGGETTLARPGVSYDV